KVKVSSFWNFSFIIDNTPEYGELGSCLAAYILKNLNEVVGVPYNLLYSLVYCSAAYFSIAYGDSGSIKVSNFFGKPSVLPYTAAEDVNINFFKFLLYCLFDSRIFNVASILTVCDSLGFSIDSTTLTTAAKCMT